MAITEDVERADAAAFPEASRADVQAALDLYTGPELSRVRLAILALAEGYSDEVLRRVEGACQDYRDILFWAEYPEDSSGGRRTRAEMAERYRRLGVAVPEALKPPC